MADIAYLYNNYFASTKSSVLIEVFKLTSHVAVDMTMLLVTFMIMNQPCQNLMEIQSSNY